MKGLLLVFTLHFGRSAQEHPGGDNWFATDKTKHVFVAAFVQSISYTSLRAAKVPHAGALAGATAVSAAVSLGKEIRDKQSGDEMHEKTEGDLYGDQRMHLAPARVRVFSAFERAGRLHRRGAQRRG